MSRTKVKASRKKTSSKSQKNKSIRTARMNARGQIKAIKKGIHWDSGGEKNPELKTRKQKKEAIKNVRKVKRDSIKKARKNYRNPKNMSGLDVLPPKKGIPTKRMKKFVDEEIERSQQGTIPAKRKRNNKNITPDSEPSEPSYKPIPVKDPTVRRKKRVSKKKGQTTYNKPAKYKKGGFAGDSIKTYSSGGYVEGK
tara:strand:+ start:1547 stop:2134 length:588 start_codon:yes stop_codon:yes gene_type:complete